MAEKKQALEGSRLNAFAMDPLGLTIVTDKEHTLYDERVNLPVEEGLIRNIMFYGVKQPILVKKEGDKVLVVAGRQRVRAAIEANKRLAKQGAELIRVPALAQRGDDIELLGIMISENENRRDDSPMTKAAKAARLLNMGRSEAEVAVAFGCTVTAVKNWLKMLELSAPVRKAIEAGAVTASAAVQLHGLEPQAQKDSLEKLLSSGDKPTAKNVAKAAKGKSTKKDKAPSKDEIREMAKRAGADATRALLAWVAGDISLPTCIGIKGNEWMKAE